MDKSSKMNAILKQADNITVHLLPKVGMRTVHRNCGLWIFRGNHSGVIGPMSLEMSKRLRYFEFYSISHMYDGGGGCYFPDGRTMKMKPGDCVMISPRTIHCYGALHDRCYCEDTINFIGPLADMLFRSGLLFNGVAELGKSRRLLPIVELANDPSDHAQLNAAFALQKLLYELYNSRFLMRSNDRFQQIDALLEAMKDAPEKWWSLPDMAEYCALGTHQFRRLFLERVGLQPKEYQDKLRMNLAAEMLAAGKYNIAEIAARCGYSDPFHFSRRFKDIMGTSPLHYRNELKLKV